MPNPPVELKRCPFCEVALEPSTNSEDDGFSFHPFGDRQCPVHGQYVGNDSWNTRPTEDALTARVGVLEKANGEMVFSLKMISRMKADTGHSLSDATIYAKVFFAKHNNVKAAIAEGGG